MCFKNASTGRPGCRCGLRGVALWEKRNVEAPRPLGCAGGRARRPVPRASVSQQTRAEMLSAGDPRPGGLAGKSKGKEEPSYALICLAVFATVPPATPHFVEASPPPSTHPAEGAGTHFCESKGTPGRPPLLRAAPWMLGVYTVETAGLGCGRLNRLRALHSRRCSFGVIYSFAGRLPAGLGAERRSSAACPSGRSCR